MNRSKQQTIVEVTKDELPMHCPAPGSALWDSHPRVFIALQDSPEVACSYCGTVFKLVENKSHSQAKKNNG